MIRTHCGNVKTILAEAVRRKVIDANPFGAEPAGAMPSKYSRYVTPDEIERVINACPDDEWRLLFGLARYAGPCIPSELHLLTWGDVDFDRGRLTVRSPKTERCKGHEHRVVPITPRLMELLQPRFDTCPRGEHRLVSINGKGTLIRPVRRIWARAGVGPWQHLWQTLRASCEKEWAMTFPQYTVSKCIRHSITTSGRHDMNAVPDEIFDRASGVRCEQLQPQQKAPEASRSPIRPSPTRARPTLARSAACESIPQAADRRSNGAGGNRTPVPIQSASRFYVRSRSFDLDPPELRAAAFPRVMIT